MYEIEIYEDSDGYSELNGNKGWRTDYQTSRR